MKANTTTLHIAPLRTACSNLSYDRQTGLFQGTITITNDGSKAISGPLQVIVQELDWGVTVANATGTYGGRPAFTAPLPSDALLPGSSVIVEVAFRRSRLCLLPGIHYGVRILAAGFQQDRDVLPYRIDRKARATSGASSQRLAPLYGAAPGV